MGSHGGARILHVQALRPDTFTGTFLSKPSMFVVRALTSEKPDEAVKRCLWLPCAI